jgi:hypothetical protein
MVEIGAHPPHVPVMRRRFLVDENNQNLIGKNRLEPPFYIPQYPETKVHDVGFVKNDPVAFFEATFRDKHIRKRVGEKRKKSIMGKNRISGMDAALRKFQGLHPQGIVFRKLHGRSGLFVSGLFSEKSTSRGWRADAQAANFFCEACSRCPLFSVRLEFNLGINARRIAAGVDFLL